MHFYEVACPLDILALFLAFPALGGFLSSTYCQTSFLIILRDRNVYRVAPCVCQAFVIVKQLRS